MRIQNLASSIVAVCLCLSRHCVATADAALIQSPRAAALTASQPGINLAATTSDTVNISVPVWQDRGTVRLAWDRSVSTNVAGYRIYYGTNAAFLDNAAQLGNVTNAAINNLTESLTWYFICTAVSTDQAESPPSNQIAVFIQPSLQIRPRVWAVDFRSRPGLTYIFQSSPDLTTWQNVQTNTGNGNVISFLRTNTGGSEFFRLKP